MSTGRLQLQNRRMGARRDLCVQGEETGEETGEAPRLEIRGNPQV